MGINSSHCNGNDANDVYQELQKVITKMRKGGGPHFIEFDTYRWREHCGPNYDNDIGYRSEEEFLEWKKLDPLKALEDKLTFDDISKIRDQVETEVKDAFDFAKSSPFPSEDEAYKGVYAQ
jgi:pyruvate dehydrogenase E1 component alpha subunit